MKATSLYIFLLLLLLSACTSNPSTQIAISTTALDTATSTPSPEPTATPAPTITFTPTPTATPTILPTPTVTSTTIGGSEPKIAYTAMDLQGNINLYIDGLFSGQPRSITKINLHEGDIIPMIKWSSDGTKLAFVNRKENQEQWLFVYDVIMNEFRELYRIPTGRYIETIKWSSDNSNFTIVTANLRPPGPNLATIQINLSDGGIAYVQDLNWRINDVTRVNNEVVCRDDNNPIFKRLRRAGYMDICYFPEIDLYGGLKWEVEDGREYDLLTEDGQINKNLLRFPSDFGTNGWINLFLSPDKSRLLIIGNASRFLGDTTMRGYPFAIPISMTDTSVVTVDPEILYYQENPLKVTPTPHVLVRLYIYGWSPDSRNYLAARFYADDYYADFVPGEFVIVNPDTREVIFTYIFQPGIKQYISMFFGFDLVWPVQP